MNSNVALIAGLLFLMTFVCDTFIAADNQFNVVPKLYEEVGCTETKNSAGNSNLKSFECPDFKAYDTNKCHLSGKSFNVGDDVEGDFVPSCRAACKCLKFGTTAHIECANVECPEHFGRRNWDCLSLYDNAKQCCRTSEICDQAKIRALNSCEVGGKTYRMGERIYPENSCYKCLCTPDYNNETSYADNSDCVKINCGMGLKLNDLRNGCVPIYFERPDCCAIEYKCPSEDDVIESHSTANESQTCKFGKLNFKRGDKLKIQDNCVNCECSIPPFITCIKSC